jgi:hypothetical protein
MSTNGRDVTIDPQAFMTVANCYNLMNRRTADETIDGLTPGNSGGNGWKIIVELIVQY